MSQRDALDGEREGLLEQIEALLETPLVVLGFAWLALLIVDLVWGLPPLLAGLMTVIWIIFILDFAVRLLLAPSKRLFLRRNWLTAISLVIPALRGLRIIRTLTIARAGLRGARVVSIVGSLNRGMGSLRRSMGRHGFGYVVSLTSIVTLVGAAGMYAFEGPAARPDGLASYGEALWWTSMVMTTLGSGYSPQTVEGRILTLILALYAFAIFGYVTATLASYLVGRDAEDPTAEVAGTRELQALREEVAALREELKRLPEQLRSDGE
ncbi:MAG: potassium channel family protein [Anaerolineae bacterium]|jgi:voltage-gated potassium channel|nr:potassium channel family protein [Anaerolineae bacterium]